MKNFFQTAAILFFSAATLMGASGERWIHVRVKSVRGVSGNVSINVPIAMATAVFPSIPTDQHQHSKFNLSASVNGMDLRAMLEAVRTSPDNVFVTLERHDQEVSVAKFGRDMLIKFAAKRSEEHPLGKTIAIKVPMSVVRAMLADNSDQVDIGAGIRALTREGDVDVTVNDEKETVRVWTDTRTISD